MGILEHDSTEKYSQMFRIFLNCIFFGFNLINAITVTWYFLFTANTFKDHTISLHFVCISILINCWYLTFFWQKREYADLLRDLDAMIEKSKNLSY